jgi:hypothetical protein
MITCLRWGAVAFLALSGLVSGRELDAPAAPASTKDVPATCANLNGASVFSQEAAPQFLGFFGSGTALNSINNPNGPYGASTSSLSVRNPNGPYGSSTSPFSARNQAATLPPIVVKYGLTIAFLTTNTTYATADYPFEVDRISLATIDASCAFNATAAVEVFSDQVGAGGFDVSFTGFWWNANRAGEGLLLEFAELNGQPILFLAFFTYDLDGNPLYLAGSVGYPRSFVGSLTVPVVSTRGGRFGPNFDPALVQRPAWGNVTVTINSCESLTLGYSSSVPGYGSGAIAMTRFLARDPFHLCP